MVRGHECNRPFNPFYYVIMTLNSSQHNYTKNEKELLAVVYAFEKFRSYFLGTTVTVHTNHAALTFLMAKKDSKPRFIRCVLICKNFTLSSMIE